MHFSIASNLKGVPMHMHMLM